MKVILAIAVVLAGLWTAFVVFANSMKSGETGGFVGGGTIAVAWLLVGVVAAAAFAG
jgi:hypothetical protein